MTRPRDGDVARDVIADVVVIGSANLDLVATTDRIPGPGETVLGSAFAEHPGGKGLNQAVAAARAGSTTVFVGAVGDDAAGRFLLDVLDADQIDRSRVATVASVPTGRAVICVDAAGENSIVVVAGANTRVDPVAATVTAAAVLAQLEVPVEVVVAWFSAGREAGATTVLNPAPATDLPDELLDQCDVVVPNEHELDLLGGAEHLLECGVGAVVVTRGGAGVDVYTIDGVWHQPAFAVTPVDTTGAGDTFCGYLVAHLARGDDLRTSVRYGAAAGALATTVAGAVPSIPRRPAVTTLVER